MKTVSLKSVFVVIIVLSCFLTSFVFAQINNFFQKDIFVTGDVSYQRTSRDVAWVTVDGENWNMNVQVDAALSREYWSIERFTTRPKTIEEWQLAGLPMHYEEGANKKERLIVDFYEVIFDAP